MVIVATFFNATCERLPVEEEEEADSVAPGLAGGGSPPRLGNMGDPTQMGGYNMQPNMIPNGGGQMNHDQAFGWAHGRPPC
ncbi:putative AT-hook motif nuclear-localized protein 15-29 [Helianthus annuus]|nr:putative AT-hook motif nuclear-localized protein 15-29 [Helianthus annuus]